MYAGGFERYVASGGLNVCMGGLRDMWPLGAKCWRPVRGEFPSTEVVLRLL